MEATGEPEDEAINNPHTTALTSSLTNVSEQVITDEKVLKNIQDFEFIRRRSIFLRSIEAFGLPPLEDGSYSEIQLEVRIDGATSRRIAGLRDESPAWQLNLRLPPVDITSTVFFVLYRHIEHNGRSLDIALGIGHVGGYALVVPSQRLEIVLTCSDMPTSACIVLRVTCDVDLTFAALNVYSLEKFVLKYNELVEDKHKLSPAIQAMPLAVLEAVFDNSVTADVLNRFGNDIRLCINVLDQALNSLRPVKPLYNRIFNKLQSLCGLHSYLPASLRLRSTKVKRKDTAHVNHGGHGYLYKGECQGRDVALKQIATDKISDMSHALKRFCKEAIVWKYLDHRNIATLLGVNVSLFPGNVCMVSPWMENGDICAYLCKNQGANRLHLLLDVAEGLMYLHSVFQVVHADIKGANVFVDDEGHALLTDFGLATIADDHDDAVDTRVTEADDRGTVRWIAPELLDSENGRTPLPTKKSDVYSLSMLMWEVFAGRVPWPELAKGAQIVYAVLKGARPLRLPHIQLLSDYLMLFGR